MGACYIGGCMCACYIGGCMGACYIGGCMGACICARLCIYVYPKFVCKWLN